MITMKQQHNHHSNNNSRRIYNNSNNDIHNYNKHDYHTDTNHKDINVLNIIPPTALLFFFFSSSFCNLPLKCSQQAARRGSNELSFSGSFPLLLMVIFVMIALLMLPVLFGTFFS